MLHKVLILIRYDEQEYENYFHAYLEETAEMIEGFSSAETLSFIQSILSHIPEYDTSDFIDLYLVRTDDGFRYPVKSKFEEMEVLLSDETQWQDEDAYPILKKILEFQDKEIVLNGQDQKIGSEDMDFLSLSYIYNDDDCIEITDSKETEDNSPDVGRNTPPSLAELMYLIAERR